MSPNSVHLHSIQLDLPPGILTACYDVVSEEERVRLRKFVRPDIGDRWLAARAGLRKILAAYVGGPPHSLCFAKEKFGKPVLAGRFTDAGVHFNFSHSGKLAVVAVTRVAPVGVDIELLRPIRDWRQVALRFFSQAENIQLAEISPADRRDAFYRCWTRKEAVIKATGEGLTAQLDSFDVSIGVEKRAQVFNHFDAQRESNWLLCPFEFGTQYVGALALRTSDSVTVKIHKKMSWCQE